MACARGRNPRLRVMVDGQPTVIIDSVFAITNAFEVVKHPSENPLLEPVAPDMVDAQLNAPPLTDARANEIVDRVRSAFTTASSTAPTTTQR